MRLTIELVPKTAWYTNVRNNVNRSEWDKIRRACYKRAGNRCEICKETGLTQGFKYAVEAHEIWEYDNVNFIQKLVGIQALCPRCHKVKHPGLANINNEMHIVIGQLKKINTLTYDEATAMIRKAFSVWETRSKFNWSLDLSFLDTYFNK